jgi:hypothetical protein
MSYFTCIRTDRFGDDIVTHLNMARGGLSFKTKNDYLVSAIVNVAGPFSRDYPAILVPIKIVRISEIPAPIFGSRDAFVPKK